MEGLFFPHSRLYWTEVSDFGPQMFYYSIINQTLSHVLPPTATNHSNGRKQCFCSVTQFEFNGAMTIDTSDLEKPQIYFVKGQEIWAMDLEGCQCWQVIMVPTLLGKISMGVHKYSLVTVALPVQLKILCIPPLFKEYTHECLLWMMPNIPVEFKSSCFQANCAQTFTQFSGSVVSLLLVLFYN